jgi:DNA-directed RNA polymerase
MRPHLDAINYLQSVAFKIDDDALDFLQELAAGLATGTVTPLLGLGFGCERKYKGLRQLLRWDLEQAELLRGKTFWLPLSCDWRGRVVPIPYLNYARGDQLRSLFRFAHGVPMDKRGLFWLMVSTANCFNENKLITRRPFEDRVQWVDDNIDRIRKVAKEPTKFVLWLSEASDPLQFVSHARELVAALDALDAGREFITTLPLPLDASNSGAQHYSLLARDPAGARLTNLTFDGAVHCVYEEVADILRNKFAVITEEGTKADKRRAAWCVEKKLADRKRTKPLVMTYLYNQSQGGQTKDSSVALREAEAAYDVYETDDGELLMRPAPKENYPDMGWFTELSREAIATVLAGAEEIKNFISGVAEALANNGHALKWTSLSGVPACNRYLKPDVHTKTTWLGASPKKHKHKVADGWLPDLRQSKCRLAGPPNLIHSFDASHLAFVAFACEAENIPLCTVHDAYATLGPYVDAMRNIWHRELRGLYGNEKMLHEIFDYARNVLGPDVKLPGIPKPRGLNLEDVTGPYALG